MAVNNVGSSFYADNARLHQHKGVSDEKSLDAMAKEFESLYLQMLLKSMREANQSFKSDIMGNNTNASDQYEEMYHNQLASELARKPGIGLAATIYEQMLPHVKKSTLDQESEQKVVMPNRVQTPVPYINHSVSKQQLETFTSFSTPNDFINRLTPEMTKAANELGVSPQLLLAQAALESGWGQQVTKSHNLFGIKADKLWEKGKQHVLETTHEFVNGVKTQVVDKFRSYKNFKESMQDYVSFIKDNPRYKKALTVASNPQEYIEELQKAGYATDPDYAKKVMNVYNRIGMNAK